MNSYRLTNRFPMESYKHQWTIDKERELWFMYASDLHDPLDRRVSLGEKAFILNYKGTNIEVVLRGISEEKKEDRKEGFFYRTWALERINPDSLDELSNDEIITLVKEALSVYGIDGIETSVPLEKIIVNCKM